MPADLAKRWPVSDIRMVSTFSASKPGFTPPNASEGTDQQGRAHQQHHGERDFADHQHRARLVLAKARAGASAAFLQGGAQIGPRSLQRGNQAEEKAGGQRDQNRESQNTPIQAHQRAFLARRAEGWRYSR